MSTIKVPGIDSGKSAFHVVGRDDSDANTLRKHFTRRKLLEYLAQLPPVLSPLSPVVAHIACA
ncbi:MAG: hypothetical protein OIF57_03760 [Marinobacterium sp.]|nr:hypothetical protein [Marinobacterium sp.]